MYDEMLNAYKGLMQEKHGLLTELNGLPEGCITTKTISGRKYHYLQKKREGKSISQYIKESELEIVRAGLARRPAIIERLLEIDAEADKLEAAAKILNDSTARHMSALRVGCMMDTIPTYKRAVASAFSDAMTALEGIPSSDAVLENLSNWAQGKASFAEGYLSTLARYGLCEAPR